MNNVLELTNSVLEVPLNSKQLLDSIDLGNYAGGPKGRFWTLDPIDVIYHDKIGDQRFFERRAVCSVSGID